MRKLFVCERPYFLYKSLIKAAANRQDEIDIVISNHMYGMEKVVPYVKASRLFRNVYYFDDKGYKEYVKDEKISDYIRFPKILISWPKKLTRYFKYQRWALEEKMPTGLEFKAYDEIVCNDGVSTINFVMFKNKICHIVSEHAKNNFQIKVGLHILAVHLSMILDFFGILPAYSGMSKYVSAVEVTENSNLVGYIKRKRIIEFDTERAVCGLSLDMREKIFDIYSQAYGLESMMGRKVNLILTSPLATDGLVENEKNQVDVYKAMIQKYVENGGLVVIKPHPRDRLNYRKYFTESVILDNSISAEILGLSSKVEIDKIITMGSTAALAFENVGEYIILGPDFLNDFKPTMQSNQFESLKATADDVRNRLVNRKEKVYENNRCNTRTI